MNKLFGVLVACIFSLMVFTGSALANEGSISLVNGSFSCEGVSLWKENMYRVTGRCQGLVYPYETQYEHYEAWVKVDDGSILRIGEVNRGYFEGNVTGAFTDVMITAEKEGLTRKPSEKQVLNGQIKPFVFEKTKTETVSQVVPTPLINKESTMTVQNEVVASTGSAVGSVIGKILKSLFVIVGVIIVLAIGASLVFRQRGSVSK